MNIFLHELKSYRKSTIIWTVSIITLVVIFMSMFPSISKDAADFKKVLEGFPASVRKAVGIELDSVTSILGFYSYIFLYVVLFGAIQAAYIGISIFSKETREKTADFLFTKPVTRYQVMTSKLLAATFSLAITSFFYYIAAQMIVSFVHTNSYNTRALALISMTLFFVQLIFFALGVVTSVLVSRIKSVITVALSMVFVFFIIGMFSSITGDDTLRYLTPFKYFDTTYILKHLNYEPAFVFTGIGVIVVAIVSSYIVYGKRDIHVA